MICADCADAADGVPGAAHCDEPGGPSWACTCGHRPVTPPPCTATIDSPHTGAQCPVPCTLPAHDDSTDHESAPQPPHEWRLYWTDQHAGATPAART